jgi:hypothetical protein
VTVLFRLLVFLVGDSFQLLRLTASVYSRRERESVEQTGNPIPRDSTSHTNCVDYWSIW